MNTVKTRFVRSLPISSLPLLIFALAPIHSSFGAVTAHPVASQIEKKMMAGEENPYEPMMLQMVERAATYLRAKLPLTSPMTSANLPHEPTQFVCNFGEGAHFMGGVFGKGNTNTHSRLDMNVTTEFGDGGPQSSPLQIQLTLAQAPGETSTIQFSGPFKKGGALLNTAQIPAQVRQLPSGVFFVLPESMNSLDDLRLVKSDDSAEDFFYTFNHYIDQFEFAGQSKSYSMNSLGLCHFEPKDEKTKQAVESEIREHDEALYHEGK